MTTPFKYDSSLHKLWIIWHHTAELLIKFEDNVFLEQAGISHQQFVILFLMAMQDEPTTATSIAHHLARNVNTLSTMLDRMESKGLVKKVRDLVDRRSVSLIMTEKGKATLQKAIISGWGTIEKTFADISPEEIQLMLHLVAKIRKSVLGELKPEEGRIKLTIKNNPEDFELENFQKIVNFMANIQA